MNFSSFQRLLRERWECVSIFIMIGAVVAMAFSLLASPKFVATSEIFLSTPQFANLSSPQNSPYLADEFSQQRARSYVQLASRVDLARRVVERLGIDLRPEELAAATSASVPADTVLISISVKSSSPADAKILADAVTAELAIDIRTLESRSGQLIPVIEPVVTGPAEAPTKPSEPDVPVYLLFGISFGLLLGVSAASLFRRRLVAGTQVQEFTGRPVLGTIACSSVNYNGTADGGPTTPDLITSQWDVILKKLAFEVEQSDDRVLAVTTENGCDRSSAVTAGLALACAEAGSRVVLVSMQPHAQRSIFSREHPVIGLAEVVAGESRLENAIQATASKNLMYLACPGPNNLAPLLGSEKFRGVVGDLRNSFDLVFMDSSEFLQLASSSLLPEIVDAVILVMAEKNIDKHSLSSAIQLIGDCQMRLLGSILRTDSVRSLNCGTQDTFIELSGKA